MSPQYISSNNQRLHRIVSKIIINQITFKINKDLIDYLFREPKYNSEKELSFNHFNDNSKYVNRFKYLAAKTHVGCCSHGAATNKVYHKIQRKI